MSGMLELKAQDGHTLNAYRADSGDNPLGAIVIIQEIFGLNGHICDLCDQYADEGYCAIAPALFDRVESGITLSYDADGIARGRALKTQVGWDQPMTDIKAAVSSVSTIGKVATIGYCWGGTLAYLAGVRLDLACSVGYYGGQIVSFKDEPLRCPVMLHFGELDGAIPLSDVESIRSAKPDVTIHLYPAGHGFNCTERVDFHPDAAALAKERTLGFVSTYLGCA